MLLTLKLRVRQFCLYSQELFNNNQQGSYKTTQSTFGLALSQFENYPLYIFDVIKGTIGNSKVSQVIIKHSE